MRFIGIDLAWSDGKHGTGAAAFVYGVKGLELLSLERALGPISEIGAFVEDYGGDSAVVAIDAPLIIANDAGMRPCECEVGRRYGARHASCHASNRGRLPQARSVQLTELLATRGYGHGTESPRAARTVIEVYPHAGYVALFDRPSIIRYKKGNVAQKTAGLREVQRELLRLPFAVTAELSSVLTEDPAVLRGKARKAHEDALDAIFCAYLAFHFWRFGAAGSDVFGDVASGYIVNPKLGSFRLLAGV